MRQHQKVFFKYAIPTILAMVVTTLYTFVDSIFIGQTMGAGALASIGIVLPFISLTMGAATMVATGGGTLCAFRLGQGETKEAQFYFNQSVLFAGIILLAFTLSALFFPRQVCLLLGASEGILQGCVDYLRHFVGFALFFGLAIVFNTFINNDKNQKWALFGMSSGCLVNVILDYLFVLEFGWGLQGAALASGLAQMLSCGILLFHFFSNKGQLKLRLPRFDLSAQKEIFTAGLPVLIAEISVPLGAMAYNNVLMNQVGEMGVAAFGVMSYIMVVVMCIFSGISYGIQPPVSRYYSQKRTEDMQKVYHFGLMISFITACAVYALMFFFSKQAVALFTSDAALIPYAAHAMRLYDIFFLPASQVIVIVSFLQAIQQTKYASIVSALKCFVFNFLFIFTLPAIFGEAGIWLAVVGTETATFLTALYFHHHTADKLQFHPAAFSVTK